MADEDYKRLCSFGTCDGKHKAQGYCLRHYRQWQRGEVKPDATNCGHCGKALEGKQNNAMYCGKRCKQEAWKAENPGRVAELSAKYAPKVRKVSAYHAAYCGHCGGAFGVRHKREYCSDHCHQQARYVSIAAPTRTCTCCLKVFDTPSFVTRPPDFCSDACARIAFKRNRRVGKLKRAASMRGVFCESVDPFKVFDRDGWRCKLCGIKTPKAKRGAYDDDAPELDHIIPLSKGGAHTYLNTQCACRKCNRDKSDKPLGHLLLVG